MATTITLPVIFTRIMRGDGPGDAQAVELMRYFDRDEAQRVNHLLNAAETTTHHAVSPNGKSIYLDPITSDYAVPFRTVRAAIAAGVPVDVDAMYARMQTP
ncbi:MAG TPA: hypothetical protein VIR54_27040 [Vicinamibacterales bacterium]|jgi:hypothetical protein